MSTPVTSAQLDSLIFVLTLCIGCACMSLVFVFLICPRAELYPIERYVVFLSSQALNIVTFTKYRIQKVFCLVGGLCMNCLHCRQIFTFLISLKIYHKQQSHPISSSRNYSNLTPHYTIGIQYTQNTQIDIRLICHFKTRGNE